VNSAGSTLGRCDVLVWEDRGEFAGCRDSGDNSTCKTCGVEGAPNKYDCVLVGVCRLNAGSRQAASCRADAAIPGAAANALSGLTAAGAKALREPAAERIRLEDCSRVDAGSEYSGMLPALTGTAGVGVDCSEIESCATSCVFGSGSVALALREVAMADCTRLEDRLSVDAESEDPQMLPAFSVKSGVAGDCSDIGDWDTSRVAGSGSVLLALAFTEKDGCAVQGRWEGEAAAVKLTGAGKLSSVFLDGFFLLAATFEFSS